MHKKTDHITGANKRKSQEDVKDVVDSLLDEVIQISEDDSTTLEESVNDNPEEKYCSVCEYCGFEFKAKRKYLAVQLLLKHKEGCHGKKN